MAVKPLTSPYKSLTFDGETSASYGVQILGEGVFNAPERDVEMIEIPGRNGAYALDKGRFQNIEVTYPANLIADSTTDFADGISDFRNFLCSKKGYVRLTDDYNPNEYRMAIYKEGLEVDEKVLRAGEFDITFECKPQRWLLSGESAITVTSGDTILNPTLFDASPLVEVYGYGDININGNTVSVNTSPIGNVSESGSSIPSYTATRTIPDLFANGDTFTVSGAQFIQNTTLSDTSWYTSKTITPQTAGTGASSYTSSYIVTITQSGASFVLGTSSTVTKTGTIKFMYKLTSDGTWQTSTQTITLTIAYDGDHTLTYTGSQLNEPSGYISSRTYEIKTGTISGYSNKVLNDPLYVDLDIGAAYKIVSSVVTPYNEAVVLPTELPVLNAGSNTITFDNTITQLDIVPRWWKV